jgi:hypothetical protein
MKLLEGGRILKNAYSPPPPFISYPQLYIEDQNLLTAGFSATERE